MMQQISDDEEEKVGRIKGLMRGYADGVDANRKLLEAAASSVDGPDMADFVQVGALISFHSQNHLAGAGTVKEPPTSAPLLI